MQHREQLLWAGKPAQWCQSHVLARKTLESVPPSQACACAYECAWPPAADISAVSDAATPINVFNHPYFNLAGLTSDNATILGHQLTINRWAELSSAVFRRHWISAPLDSRWPATSRPANNAGGGCMPGKAWPAASQCAVQSAY